MSSQERVILHCDLNNFFASVECMLNPQLREFPVAVCGDVENRHGIVLAKNEIAKKFGVKTAEAIWQAKAKCKDLLVVKPHFEEYYKYSRLAREIYGGYTDQVESFGIDECWLDVTGSTMLFGSGEVIANKIRCEMKEKLGLTISVGVSFNKIFAKLGSDMKKPDAVTCITTDSYKKQVWPLAISELLGVGKSTAEALQRLGVFTIGDMAGLSEKVVLAKLGKNGCALWLHARGIDNSPVLRECDAADVKSVGNSITCRNDLTTPGELWPVLLLMAESVSQRLRDENLTATSVVLSIKDNKFRYTERSQHLPIACRSAIDMAEAAMRIFEATYSWQSPVRAVGIRAIGLEDEDSTKQISLFDNSEELQRNEIIESNMDNLRKKYGKTIIKRAVLMNPAPDMKHHGTDASPMPTFHSK